MKFEQLILKKIIKIVATRCQILRLKCTRIDFGYGWGSAPDPAAGHYSATRPSSWNEGDLLLRKGEECRKEGGAVKKRSEGGERRGEKGGKGRLAIPSLLPAPLCVGRKSGEIHC